MFSSPPLRYEAILAGDYEQDYASAHRCPEAQEFVSGLLHTDPGKRLGGGGAGPSGDAHAWSHEQLRTGRRQVRTHPFFAGLDHDMLTSRRIPPPFLPRESGRGQTDTVAYFDKRFTGAKPGLPQGGHPHAGGATPAFDGFDWCG